jgi:hypothetical protein
LKEELDELPHTPMGLSQEVRTARQEYNTPVVQKLDAEVSEPQAKESRVTKVAEKVTTKAIRNGKNKKVYHQLPFKQEAKDDLNTSFEGDPLLALLKGDVDDALTISVRTGPKFYYDTGNKIPFNRSLLSDAALARGRLWKKYLRPDDLQRRFSINLFDNPYDKILATARKVGVHNRLINKDVDR